MVETAAAGGAEAISVLIGRAGRETRKLSEAARRIEQVVADLLAGGGAIDGASLVRLQELDRLAQHADGLADYLAALSAAAADLGHVDAAEARRTLKLAALADGLAGRGSSEPAFEGDVEFL